MGLSLVRRLGVHCYDNGLTGSILMLWVVLVTMVVIIFRFTLTPTTAVVCFRMVIISGSIVLYIILHGLHSACYCGGGGIHPLGLPLITVINAMALPYNWF